MEFEYANGPDPEIQGVKKSKKRYILYIILAVLLIVGGVYAGTRLVKPAEQVGGGVGLYVDPNAKGYVAQTDNAESTQGVAIPGWGSMTIPAGSKNITVDFYNPEDNAGLYYLTFQLCLPDSSEDGYEVLYTSGLVKPGLHIQNIQLSRALSAGTYNAVIRVQPYRMDEDKTPTNNADMNTTLIVK
jgi:flagellar basal body-associated protein FliL